MELVAFGLGANLGDPERQLGLAVAGLASRLSRPRVASLWSTPPLPGPLQPDYTNTVVVGHADRSSHEWLTLAKTLEVRAGRLPGARWGPRLLDVDVLLVGDRIVTSKVLTLPHPGLAQRRFVLGPLAELVPDLALPGLGVTVAAALAALATSPATVRSWRRPPIC